MNTHRITTVNENHTIQELIRCIWTRNSKYTIQIGNEEVLPLHFEPENLWVCRFLLIQEENMFSQNSCHILQVKIFLNRFMDTSISFNLFESVFPAEIIIKSKSNYRSVNSIKHVLEGVIWESHHIEWCSCCFVMWHWSLPFLNLGQIFQRWLIIIIFLQIRYGYYTWIGCTYQFEDSWEFVHVLLYQIDCQLRVQKLFAIGFDVVG